MQSDKEPCACMYRGYIEPVKDCAIKELERQLEDHVKNKLKQEFERASESGRRLGRSEVIFWVTVFICGANFLRLLW